MNGIKMTGMPSFGAEDPPVADRTIWTIVAFVKKLPSVSGEDFKAWSAAPAGGGGGCGSPSLRFRLINPHDA